MANMIVQVRRDRYKCRYCGQMLRTNEVDNHKDMHTNPYMCYLCGENFAKKSVLKDHFMRVHKGGNIPRCTICRKSFSGKVALIMHRREAHPSFRTMIIIRRSRPGSEVSYVCNLCGKEFIKKENLKMHKRKKHSKCNLCGKEFKNKKDMKRHKKRKHPKCDVCGRRFITKTALKRHKKRKHTEPTLR